MALLKKSSSASVKKPPQTWDHMPRRRKRHNRIMLILLILVNCCSTFILCLPDVQAKDLNATILKGEENILSNDRHNTKRFGIGNDLAKGEDNVEVDKSNDKNTSESRIQLRKSENKNDDDSERSSEVIEMIQQPSLSLRHQEHYNTQQQQQQKDQQQNIYQLKQKTKEQNEYQAVHKTDQISENNFDNIDDVDDNEYNDNYDADDDDGDGDDINDDNEYNRHFKYQHIQEALKESITHPTPHHHRHENHLAKKRLTKQKEFKIPQHHLRHQHQHQHQHQNQNEHQHQEEFSGNKQPQLRHLNHEIRKENLTNPLNLKTKPLHQRYFDRESSYPNPFSIMVSTEGPHLRHSGTKRHGQAIIYNQFNDQHNPILDNDAKITSNQMKDIKRFSLSLDTNENESDNNPRNEKVFLLPTHKDTKHYNVNENINDAGETDDDYSYEDDDQKEELNDQVRYSSMTTTNAKTNVKRYTNPLGSPYNQHPLRNQHSNDNDYDYENENEDNVENTNENYNRTPSSSSTASFASNKTDESLSDNDNDKFSDESWNKIEHEHFRKQLQHQRAMQALRYRGPINGNSPSPHQYSSYSTVSYKPTSTYNNNNAWTKRQTVNNDDEENIYSRYYVPGTMTHKKEEELGSPTAILETRRQYALQQRQNKALASAHHRRIVTEGSCRLPQPRVERIRKDSWKIYTPHCTILHRCADDAGCCPSERQTCAPKRTKSVDLYFFVISLNETQGSIEKLTFVNHTECHCVDRSKQRAPEYGNSRSKEFITNNQIPFLRRATILNCYCPNLFEKILQEDGYCRCDCSSGNMGCDWLKRGMEHFSMNDRKCIIEGRCKLPTCEYGQYIKKHGRCPRREERHISADIDW